MSESEDGAPVSLDLLAPSCDEQRAIISCLESEGSDESLYVYTVSQAWYERWAAYVGMEQTTSPRHSRDAPNSVSPDSAARQCPVTRSADEVPPSTLTPGVKDKKVERSCTGPGPLEMDLTDDDNIAVDEKVWLEWVKWYGVADQHELDRRRWTADERDFEICVLSPYCGLVENAVKSFDVSEQTGYIELQLRRVFRVPDHRQTRLWICEKSRHSRFLPLLDRPQQLCFQDCVDVNKNYILAIEVSNLDGTWPTLVPGHPVGSFDCYKALVGRRPAATKAFWETELGGTLETVFSGITTELKETANGIVSTAKCMTSERETELSSIQDSLINQLRLAEEQRTTADRQSSELSEGLERLSADKAQLEIERRAFNTERQAFSEELVRINHVNKIHDSRVKLCVGGQIFMTSTLTLTKDSTSMLAAMFSGRHSLHRDDDGTYFIDRDGTHFRYILNYLRDGGFRAGTLPADTCFLGELLTEAEYYQLTGLTDLLSEHIKALSEACSTLKERLQEADVTGVRTTETGGASTSRGHISASPGNRRLQRKVSTPQNTK